MTITIKGTILHERAPNLFTFKLFELEECERLMKRIERYKAKQKPEPPNSMNRYGAKMAGELRPLLARLSSTWVQPVASVCTLKNMEGASSSVKLRKHPYAFTVDYTPRTQSALAAHVDSSDWTLNVCLGRTFSGGDLLFPEEGIAIRQVPGFAVIHPGKMEHRALGVKTGERTNLVLWCLAKKR